MNVLQIFENHAHWQDIVQVIGKLTRQNHTTYLAGGCVRDALLNKTPHDFDVATSAQPSEIKKIFPNALEVGRAFGVMIVPIKDFNVEITTFRTDGNYKDGRHPETITFSNPKEDAQRRDFTINALFYDLKTNQIIDYVGGIEDLNRKVIRTVGHPEDRFREDKLRVLRAARFASQLEFSIAPETEKSLSLFAHEINQVSRERITQEFRKITFSRDPARAILILFKAGLLDSIWPEISLKFENGSTAEEGRELDELTRALFKALNLAAPINSFVLTLACFLIVQELREQNQSPYKVSYIEKRLDPCRHPFLLTRVEARILNYLFRGIFKLLENTDEALLLLNDENGPLLTELGFVLTQCGLLPLDLMRHRVDQFLAVADENGELPEQILDGNDFIRLGCKSSPDLKHIMKDNYLAQLRGEFKSKDEAQDWVLERLKS